MSIRTYEYSCLNLSSRGTSTNRFLNGNPVRVTIPDSFIAYSKFFRMNTAFPLFFLYYITALLSALITTFSVYSCMFNSTVLA